MDVGERQGDPRVPLISGLFFLLTLSGGIILCLWVFDFVEVEWAPQVAFVLIGLPWFFWMVVYIYALSKICFFRDRGGNAANANANPNANAPTDRQVSKRSAGTSAASSLT